MNWKASDLPGNKPTTPTSAPGEGKRKPSSADEPTAAKTGPRESQGRDTPKEQPGPRPGTPVRWNEASGLFRQQHPGMFRIVVVGKDCDKEKVIEALETATGATPPQS